MDSTTIERLARVNVEDLLANLGLDQMRAGRGLLQRLFLGAGRRFARQVLTFDDEVARLGLQAGSALFLKSYINSLEITGQQYIPKEGPLLVLANHPGMTDTIALFASLPRSDLRTVAAERPFLDCLPAVRQTLIFVPDKEGHRIQAVREIAAHLRQGGAILNFPAGQIEPDPSCMPGASESIDGWGDSVGFFARLVPDACLVPAIVSGVIAAPSLRHPLTRLRRQQKDREKLAASLQLLERTFFPGHWPIHVKVNFAPPITASQLSGCTPAEISRAVIEHTRSFLSSQFSDNQYRAVQLSTTF